MNAVNSGILTVLATFGFFQLVVEVHPVAAQNRAQVAPGVSPAGGFTPTPGGVRQVSDTSGQSRSGGILGSLFGSRNSTPAKSTAQQPARSSRPLSGLFSGGGDSGKKDDDGRRVIEPVIPSEEPDWTGIPFHEANPAIAAQDKTPLYDPRDPSNRRAAGIRHPGDPPAAGALSSGSAPRASAQSSNAQNSSTPRSTAARTVSTPSSSRIPVPPTMAEAAAARRAIPVPRSTAGGSAPAARVASNSSQSASINTSTFQPPSSTESNRRSRRREVDPLHVEVRPEEVADQSEAIPTAVATTGEPRVARRALPTNPVTTESSTSETNEPTVSRTPAPSSSRRSVASTTPATPQANPANAATESIAANAGASAVAQPNTGQAPAKTPSTPSHTTQETDPIAWRPARREVPSSATPSAVTNQPASVEPAPTAANIAADVPGTITAAPTPPATNTTASPDLLAPNDTPALTLPAETIANQPEASSTAIGRNGAEAGQPNMSLQTEASPNSIVRSESNDSQPLRSAPAAAPNKPAAVASVETAVATPNASAVLPTNNQSVNVRSEIPGLRVVTTGPADIPVRQPSIYQIVVENRGVMDAPGAAIQIKLPPWIDVQNLIPSRGEIARQNDNSGRQLLWVVEGLPRATNEQLTLHLVAQRAEAFDVDVEWAVVPQTNTAHISVREPKLEMLIEGPDQVVYGQSETYTVRVLNPGNGEANNVVFTLSPNSATPQTQRVSSIPAGKEAKFEVELTARDLENLQIHGLATADLNLKQERIKTIEVTSARLRAVLSGPALNYQDSFAEYRLQLANDGTAACRNITAVIELPPGVVYRGGLDGAQVEGNHVKWIVPELGIDNSVEFGFQCQMQRTGEQQIGFRCQGSAAGATSVAFQTRVEALADLVLTINDPAAPAPVGEDVSYEIVVHNRGSKAATDVVTIAQFGPDVEPIRIEGSEGDIEPGQVKFHSIARIDAGATVRLKVLARAEKAGHHRFRAEVQCGDTLLIAEEATRYMELVGQRISRRSDESPSDR